jgi:hypothetical protein
MTQKGIDSNFESNELSVLVLSCDKYKDLWDPFFTLFSKYWSDCPCKIYLCSNNYEYKNGKIITIKTGDDITWSLTVKKCLQEIDSRYILLLQEDFLLRSPVDNSEIQRLFQVVKRMQAGCLRLYPSPPPQKIISGENNIGEILKGSEYRVSLQAAIWEKRVLSSLLKEEEDPWQFEHKGTLRSDSLETIFLSVKGKAVIDYFSTAVVGGVWLRNAVNLCKKEGIVVRKDLRKIEPYKDYLLRITLYNLRDIIKKAIIGMFGKERMIEAKNSLTGKYKRIEIK